MNNLVHNLYHDICSGHYRDVIHLLRWYKEVKSYTMKTPISRGNLYRKIINNYSIHIDFFR